MNPAFTAPSLTRRLRSMLYESMLLFGVLFFAGMLFFVGMLLLTPLLPHQALYLRGALQGWLFVVIGIYCVWFWTHGGQTLAMKTWRIRLVTADGQPVGALRALGRYLLAWCWCVPGLIAAWLAGAQGWLLVLIPVVNLLLWALTVYLDPERRFLHDRLAGTRLVDAPVPPPKAARR